METATDIALGLGRLGLLVAWVNRLDFWRIRHIDGFPSILIIIYRIINWIWVQNRSILIIIWHFARPRPWISSSTPMIGRCMSSNNSILWILRSAIRPIGIMLNSIMRYKLLIHITLSAISSHLALISHMIASRSRVRSLTSGRRSWSNVLVSHFGIVVTAIILARVVSSLGVSWHSMGHFTVSRLVTSAWDLIRCVFMAVLSCIGSFNIFNVLLDVGAVGDSL